MAELEIRIVPVLSDNYVHLIRDPDSGACAVIDPGEAEPVRKALDGLGWRPTLVLCTHHHADHIGGSAEIKQAFGCRMVGAAADAHRIPGLDQHVREGDLVELGLHRARVFEVPGHTSGHIAYWFDTGRAVFCGDTLFSLGCGKLFEGTPQQMWASLLKLRALPDETRVYCGHEYTQSNARFALAQEPANAALKKRADEVAELRRKGQPTVPSLLGEEKAANPFLRADVPAFQQALRMAGQDPVAVFAEVRGRKDRF